MKENNFNTEIIVYPGSGGTNEETHIAVSEYFNFGICAGTQQGENFYGYGKYQLGRYFLKSEDTFEDFKGYVTSCEEKGTPLILGSHSGSAEWSSDEWNTEFVEQCIDYLIQQDYTFVTATQLCKMIEPLFDNYYIYSNKL